MSRNDRSKGNGTLTTGGARGFTLVELLVVVGIIALLVTILMPSLGRALMLARRAACKTTMHSHGRSLLTYVHDNGQYPVNVPFPWHHNDWMNQDYPALTYADDSFDNALYGLSKIYGVFQSGGIKGTKMTTWGIWYYGGPVNAIWDGAFCPAMKQNDIFRAADKAGDYGDYDPMYRVSNQKWAVGWQWNQYFRGAHPRGRFPAHLSRTNTTAHDYLWQWIGHRVGLPRQTCWTQAVSPDEVEDPASKAEAWDSWDLESAPLLKAQWGNKSMGGRGLSVLAPGWHIGVSSSGGRALLNANRHEGSPNILYTDGHVASDADEPVTGFGASLAGLTAVTWDDYNTTYGTMHHVIPRREFGR